MAALIYVAVGVLTNASGRVLIARRGADLHQGGLWEFPGGKVESGEDVRQALARELLEELGIRVEASEPLLTVERTITATGVLRWIFTRLATGRVSPGGRRASPWPGSCHRAWTTTNFPRPTWLSLCGYSRRSVFLHPRPMEKRR